MPAEQCRERPRRGATECRAGVGGPIFNSLPLGGAAFLPLSERPVPYRLLESFII